MAKRRSSPRRAVTRGAQAGLGYGVALSIAKGAPMHQGIIVSSVTSGFGAGVGYSIHKYKTHKEGKMAKGKAKGGWSKGNAPAQGSAGKHKITRPVEGAGKYKKGVSKGMKTTKAKSSPLDGRKKGKK